MKPQYSGPQPEKIRNMFSDIAEGYDLANTILSLGVHHLWRRAVVEWSGAKLGDKVLDCATGTGDLAIEFKRAVGDLGEVIGTDFCEGMLKSAPLKAAKRGLKVHFEQADVMNLPYESDRFDISSIAFGIRNVQDPVKAICELGRVIKPGGSVMILEFGQPSLPGLSHAYRFYSQRLLPRVGGLITGKRQAYEYLQNSSYLFPCREDFVNLMKSTGIFRSVDYKPLSLGIAYIYKATK